MSKRPILWFVAAAAVAAAALLAYRALVPVARVATAVTGTAVQAVPGNVSVRESFIMEIKSEIGGRVAASGLRLGAVVRKDDPLIEIDPTDLKIEIERIESDYRAFRDRVELGSPLRFEIQTAEETLRTNSRLLEQGRYAQLQLNRDKRSLDQLRDRLRNEEIQNSLQIAVFENTLKAKRRQVEKMRLTAPQDGVVTRIFARPGDLVGGGMVLAEIISNEREVELRISEESIAGVRTGLPVQVQFVGYSGRQFSGTIERVLPNADERTKRYTAFLKLEIDPELLVPGLTGEATVLVDRRENATLVERRGLLGRNLLVVRKGRVEVVAVELGYTGLNVAEILQGVTPGTEYVVDALGQFRDGDRVRSRPATDE